MNDEQFKKAIATAFEYSYLHDDWVTPLDEVLAGLTIEAALWRTPAPHSKCIWEIVLHTAVWNENIVDRVNGGPERPVEGAWPPLPSEKDPPAWSEAKERLRNALKSVQEMIENTDLEKIEKSRYGVADLLCRLVHNGYHLGQIAKMRECMNA